MHTVLAAYVIDLSQAQIQLSPLYLDLRCFKIHGIHFYAVVVGVCVCVCVCVCVFVCLFICVDVCYTCNIIHSISFIILVVFFSFFHVQITYLIKYDFT
jgi:hypothetical protein